MAGLRRHAGGNGIGKIISRQADGNVQACIKSPINMYPRPQKMPKGCSTYGHLKGLSHEIDFDNIVKNLQM